ncbi:ABC transporter ATP-binding protein [Proteiniborus sp.]|uniref:energy-coupling factor ABC transporter ATP-binding protein n=1 Tax=Proteiniborus sp. TaxID=2079015 RepID=UPI0033338527
MRTILETRELSFSYSEEHKKVLDSININIERGSITAIAGLSGCGKSTLAFCLSGIIPKSILGKLHGIVLIDGKDIKEFSLPNLSQKIGVVFQNVDNQLFLPTTEAEIAFALENLCFSYDDIHRIVANTLGTLGIEHLRHKNPSKLSGGEKHLVAIASVLSLDPEIIILDEALSQLDEENRNLVINAIEMLSKKGKTIVLIDHRVENLIIADSILLMRDGTIIDRIEGGQSHEFLYNRLYKFFLQ